MTKKVMLLVALVFAFSMALAACGDSESAAPSAKNTATATMTEGEMPIEVTVDVSTGLSVAFDNDGFYKYTSGIGEACCLWKIGDKVPFMMSFEKSVDGDRADEIVGCLEFDY